MRLIYRIVILLCLQPAIGLNASPIVPPYSIGFDSSWGSLGNLDGQNNWTVHEGTADVIVSPVQRGDQSVVIHESNPNGKIGVQFDQGTGQEHVLVDVWVKPFATSQANGNEFLTIEGTYIGFVEEASGTQGQIYAFSGNGTGGGTWQGTSKIFDINANDVSLDFIRLTIFQDYVNKTFKLYVNGSLAADDFGFVDDSISSPPASRQIFLYGNDSEPFYIDQVSVYTGDTTYLADDNDDGILEGFSFMPEHKFDLGATGENLINTSDNAGWAVSVQGDRLIWGAYDADGGGVAHVYNFDGTSWVHETALVPSDLAGGDYFGRSICQYGPYCFIASSLEDAPGLSNTGAVYIFKKSSGTWTEMQKVTADVPVTSGYFGNALAAHGDRFVVGADNTKVSGQTGHGAAYIFTRSGETWTQDSVSLTDTELDAYDYFGTSVAIEFDWVAVSAYKDEFSGTSNNNSGAVYIWHYDGTNWNPHSRLTHPAASPYDTNFGASIAMSEGWLAVGSMQDDGEANNAGSVILFKYNSGTDTWEYDDSLYASDAAGIDYFGSSVDLYGDTLIAGAKYDDDGGSASGSAYVFRIDPVSGTWVEQTKLVASDDQANDAYSLGLAVGSDFIAVGANQEDDAGADAGAVYTYKMIQPATLNISDTEAPSIPEDLSLIVGTNVGLTFGWHPSWDNIGVTGYDVFRDGTYIGTTAGSAFEDVGLSENIYYYYTVKAFDAAGNISAASTSFAYIIDTLAPDIPQNLVLDSVSINSATISWDASSDNVATTSYRVFRDGVEVGTTSTTQYTDLGLSTGVDYGYTVSALDEAVNESLESAELVVNIDPNLQQDSDGDGIDDLTELALGTDPSDWDSDDDGEGDGWEHASEWKLIPSDSSSSDYFGWSAAIERTRAVIGAYGAGSPAAGNLYTFTFDGANWNEEQIITSNDNANGDRFGESVDIFNDWIFVSARDDDIGGLTQTGAVYVFRQSGGTWTEHQKLTASDYSANSYFGCAIAAHGNYLIVGASKANGGAGVQSGQAYIYETDSTANWQEKVILTDAEQAAYDFYGHAVGITSEFAAVGAYQNDYSGFSKSGTVFIYKRIAGVWTSVQKITHPTAAANDNFGYSIAMDGDVLAVGSIQDDDATSQAGAVFIYRYNSATDTWEHEDSVYARDAQATDYFGYKCNLKADTLMVNAYYDDDMGTSSGSAYVYRYNDQTGDWEHQMKFVDSNGAAGDAYGHGLAVGDDFLVAGSFYDDEPGANSGSAFIYKQPIPVSIEDSEPDDLPDSWEQQIVDYNTSDGITDVAGVLPEDDFDGDGLTNLEEYIGGSDPTDIYSAPPGVYFVDANAPGPNYNGTFLDPMTLISDAVAAANDLDKVVIAPGTYTGSGNRDIDFAGKKIHLKGGAGPESTILDLEASGRAFYFHSGETYEAIVEGVTIVNGDHTSDTGGAFYISSASSPVIKNCIIKNNYAEDKGGAFFITGSATTPMIVDCTIVGNKSTDGAAIFSELDAVPYITFNLFSLNIANINENGGNGIIYGDGSDPVIINNTFVSNEAGPQGTLYFSDLTAPVIANNIVAYNSAGLYNADQISLIENNIIHDNKVADYLNMNDPVGTNGNANDGAGLGESKYGDNERYLVKGAVEKTVEPAADDVPLHLSSRYLLKSAMDTTQGHKIINDGPELVPHPIFVDGDVVGGSGDGSSWENAKSSIADAVVAANTIADVSNGVAIYVKETVDYYDVTATLELSPLVNLYGGYAKDLSNQDVTDWDPEAYATVLDGGSLPLDTETGILVIEGTGSEANEINGFTFQNARVIADLIEGKMGAAIHVKFASPEIRNCNFYSNSNGYLSCGAIFLGASNAEITLCTFEGNTAAYSAGAIGIIGGGQGATVSHCVFRDNIAIMSGGAFVYTGDGIGGYNYGGTLELKNCEFIENYSGNGGGAIALHWNDEMSVENCLIVNNSSLTDGGGIYLVDAEPSIINCTIVGNEAEISGAGIYIEKEIHYSDPTVTIVNTICVDNQIDGQPSQIEGDLDNLGISYSNVEGWTGGGTGNIDAYAAFADATNLNFRLNYDSPCRDTGDPASAASVDLDGTPRPQPNPGTIDMGCYEVGKDFDGDEMWDEWEQHFFGTTNRDDNGDFDNDGVSDLAEFNAGSDPSVFSSIVITVTNSGKGTTTGAGTYAVSGQVTLIAAPDEGYSFVDWTGDTSGITGFDPFNPTLSFTADINRNITANYAKNEILISVSVRGAGHVMGDGWYPRGANVTLTAIPEPNAQFVRWVTDAERFDESDLEDSTLSFEASEALELTAHFSQQSLEVNGTWGGIPSIYYDSAFGSGVAISNDTFVVGSVDPIFIWLNNVHIFRIDNSGAAIYEGQQSESNFKEIVDLDGDILICGAPEEDSVHVDEGGVFIYQRNGSSWNRLNSSQLNMSHFSPSDIDRAGNLFGSAVAVDRISDDEYLIAVGAPGYDGVNGLNTDAGAVVIFRLVNGSYIHEFTFYGYDVEDEVGSSVDVFGNYVAIGAPGRAVSGADSGAAYVLRREGGTWSPSPLGGQIDSGVFSEQGGLFGQSISLYDGNVLVGAPFEDGNGVDSGAAYVFYWTGNSWALKGGASIVPSSACSNCSFGKTLSLSSQFLAIGEPDNAGGYVYLYKWNGSTYEQHGSPISPPDAEVGDRFGAGLDLDNNTLIVSAPDKTLAPSDPYGYVYLYSLSKPYLSITKPVVESAITVGDDFSIEFVVDNTVGISESFEIDIEMRVIDDGPWVVVKDNISNQESSRYTETIQTTNLGIGRYEVRVMAKGAVNTAYSDPIILNVYVSDDYSSDDDSDDDDIPDYLELLYFGSLDSANGTSDNDYDSVFDITEIANGTDPTDASNTLPTIKSVHPRIGGTIPRPMLPTSDVYLTVNFDNVSNVSQIEILDKYNKDITSNVEIFDDAPNGFVLSIDPGDSKYISGAGHSYTVNLDDGAGNDRSFNLFFRIDNSLPVVNADIEEGRFFESFSVGLEASETDCEIFYSTDGSDPSLSYTVPISIPSTTVLRYKAKDAAGNFGPIGQSTYLFGDLPAPLEDLTVSLIPVESGVPLTARLEWTSSSDPETTGYIVYRADTLLDLHLLNASVDGAYPPPHYLRIVEKHSPFSAFHSDFGLVEGPPLYYAVTAVNNLGEESIASNIATLHFDGMQTGAADVESAVKKATRWLEGNQRLDASWPEKRFGVFSSTIAALNGLSNVEGWRMENTQNIKKILHFLRGNYIPENDVLSASVDVLQRYGLDTYGGQIRLQNKGYYVSEGAVQELLGWGADRQFYPSAVESAWGIIALRDTENLPFSIDKVEDILLGDNVTVGIYTVDGSRIESKNIDRYAWSSGSPESIYVSSLAYHALGKNRFSPANDQHSWVNALQETNGSFNNSLLDTAAVLNWLPLDITVRGNAVNYLVNEQSINGSWKNDAYLTGLCLEALAKPKITYVWSGETNSHDTAMQDILQARGYVLELVDDSEDVPDDIANASLIFISGTVEAVNVSDKYRDIPISTIVCHAGLYDEMGMVNILEENGVIDIQAGIEEAMNSITLSSEAETSILGANFSNAQSIVVQPAGDINWGIPNSSAISIAEQSNDSTHKTIFAYDTGAIMSGGFEAPARRIGFFVKEEGAGLSSEGKDLLDAAVNWAANRILLK